MVSATPAVLFLEGYEAPRTTPRNRSSSSSGNWETRTRTTRARRKRETTARDEGVVEAAAA